MPNPQQSEVRRSERNPALSPDAMEAKLEARDHELKNAIDHQSSAPAASSNHSHDAANTDEDQPDPDAFAEAFGIKETS